MEEKKSISEKQKQLVEEFSFFQDWEEKYNYLIDLGKSMEGIPAKKKTDSLLIKGCQSKVWLLPKMENGFVYFNADSDAIIPKGIAALLVRAFSGFYPMDIAQADSAFVNQIGLTEFLSPTRSNGLLAMIKQIKFYAVGFSLKQKEKCIE